MIPDLKESRKQEFLITMTEKTSLTPQESGEAYCFPSVDSVLEVST